MIDVELRELSASTPAVPPPAPPPMVLLVPMVFGYIRGREWRALMKAFTTLALFAMVLYLLQFAAPCVRLYLIVAPLAVLLLTIVIPVLGLAYLDVNGIPVSAMTKWWTWTPAAVGTASFLLCVLVTLAQIEAGARLRQC